MCGSIYRYLGEKAAGFIFLGVPFRGSGAQRLGNLIASSVGKLGLAENNLIKDLGLDSETLGNLLYEFSTVLRDLGADRAICYYEMLKTSYANRAASYIGPFSKAIPKKLVVERSSGTIDGCRQFGLTTDHTNMSRFGSKEDKIYVQISNGIHKLVTTYCPEGAHGYIQDNSRINLRLRKLRDSLENSRVGKATREEKEKEIKLAEEFVRGLSLSNPLDSRQHIISMKGEGVPGTCAWILSDENFRAWSEGPDSKLLWLSGGPGKGKTVISIFLTKELARVVKDDQNATLVYFFCDSENEKQMSALAILRSLILQLLQQRPDLIECILPGYDAAPETLFSNRGALWKIFEKMISSLRQCKTYCILDGLDECDPDSLSFLVTMIKGTVLFQKKPSGAALKLIAVSRDTRELRRLSRYSFPNSPSCPLRVDLDSPSLRNMVETDLQRFILQETEQLTREDDYTLRLQEDVKRALTNGAKGTFLWVAMVCRELRATKGLDEVPETLEKFPQGLDNVYERMLAKIPPPRREVVATILRWVTLAARPLTLSELAIATKVKGDGVFSAEEAMKLRVLSCGNFLEINRDARVSFIHQSAKDYLLNHAPHPFRVEKEAASLELAQTCHTYIRDEARLCGRQGGEVCRSIEERFQQFPFLAYATLHWPGHLRDSDSIEGIPIVDSEWGSNLRNDWWETYCYMANDSYYSKREPTILHVASYFDLTLLAKKILSTQGPKNCEQTVLPWAARAGHQAMVELLLENGIDPNAKEEFGTALSWAAKNGHKPLVELLLRQENVDVNLGSNWDETPLAYAAGNGHEEVVRLLLGQNNLDVSAKGKWGWMPLWIAARNGHDAMVSLLLSRKGVDNTSERTAGWALLLAAAYGREGVVRLLLEQAGMDVNTRDDEQKTPLSLAAENGNVAVVRLLLQQGSVDVNACDRYGWTPLLMAARNVNEAVMKLLLGRRGIEVDSRSNTGRTLLSLAAEHGLQRVVVDLLRREEVDPNSKDESNWTPLSHAAANGHDDIVRLLLAWDGVDVNAKDGWDFTPVSMAASNGHEAVAIQLLNHEGVEANIVSSTRRTLLSFAAEKGLGDLVSRLLDSEDTDLNSEDESGRTPLSYAAQNGHEVAVSLLLGQKHAGVNFRDGSGRTPLSYAADNGSVAVVKLLLDRQPTGVNLKDWSDRTPLSYAAEKGHEVVVRLLLSRQDVSVNSKDVCGLAPLSYAARSGRGAVVRLFLEREGVDLNLGDNRGRTPLSSAAENGHEGVVGLLLDREDVDFDLRDNWCLALLSSAAKNGYEAVVRALLGRVPLDEVYREVLVELLMGRRGVESSWVQDLLSFAAVEGSEAVLRTILTQPDVDINRRDHRGRTPLSYAAEHGHEAVAGLLLAQQGVRVNLGDQLGRTPLSYAAGNGHEAVVRQFLGRRDVATWLGDEGSRDPLTYAAEKGHEAVVKLLLGQQDMHSTLEGRRWGLLSSVAKKRHEGVVRLLLGKTRLDQIWHEAVVRLLLDRQDVDVNLTGSQGHLLSYAAENGHTEVVRVLLERQNVDVNLKDSYGQTPLISAARGGHRKVVGLLLGQPDVDVNLKDTCGRTPLFYAARNGDEAVVGELLAREGVDVNLADRQGQTPLSFAEKWGQLAVARLILDRQGVDANLTDSRCQTALPFAAESRDEAVARPIGGDKAVTGPAGGGCQAVPEPFVSGGKQG